MARYELIDGSSRKFWEVTRDGASLTTRWGRIGAVGQSKTKDFADAAAAQKELDALVREKTAKGYALAAGSIRTDLSVYNEATAFLITSESMVGRQLTPDDPRWTQAIADGDLLPVELVQDDPFVIRVVAGGELTEAERDEAIGQLAWKLRVPDGRLVIAGGIELVMEPAGSEVADHLAQYARRLDVPPGEYDATLLAYVHGINGESLLNRARGRKGEGVGAWYRRTRGDDLPVWVRFWCHADPREDTGHEDDWSAAPSRRERATQESTEYVHFLLHLTPIGSTRRAQPPLEQGFFPVDACDVRLPERCPVGIVSAAPAKPPKPPVEKRVEDDEPPLRTIDVLTRVRRRKLTAVHDGPVEHPIVGLGDVYRLAWLATDAADPEVRIELPDGSRFVPSWPEVETVAVSTSGRVIRVGFAGGGKWVGLAAAESIGKHLGDLPDGSVVELMTSPGTYFWEHRKGEPAQHPDAGVHRYRGVVRGGTWFIEDTFPAVNADALREALALSASVKRGRTLALRDGAEGDAVQRRLDHDRSLFASNPVAVEGAEIRLSKRDVSLLHSVAAAIFRTRWAGIWPPYAEDAAADAAFEAAMKQLTR